MHTDIVWNPLIDTLFNIVNDDSRLSKIIAPFVQSSSLEFLKHRCPFEKDFCLLTRWKSEDLRSGVSDPDVYLTLKKLGFPLFINDKLHAKLFVNSRLDALVGSGNLTNNGMGINDLDYQIELGAVVKISQFDWLRILSLIEGSIRVDDSIYTQACEIAEKKGTDQDLINIFDEKFNIYHLPVSCNPGALWEEYSNSNPHFEKILATNKIWQDILRYQIPLGISCKESFEKTLKRTF